jgi:hypothetical protein
MLAIRLFDGATPLKINTRISWHSYATTSTESQQSDRAHIVRPLLNRADYTHLSGIHSSLAGHHELYQFHATTGTEKQYC